MRNLGLEIVAIHPDSGNVIVMAGLVPAIHVFLLRGDKWEQDVDARLKAGHDDLSSLSGEP
jgi:hypothetical protein